MAVVPSKSAGDKAPYFPTTTFRYEGSDYPILKEHTPKRLAYDILNVNEFTIYTLVNLLGLPGWGKTTATQGLVHEMHEIEPSFVIRWFQKDDILKIDELLEKLPKQTPHILVFDDVSYTLQKLGEEKKNQILHKLTTVREILDPQYKRTRCIIMMDFHYSYAVPKAFRQAVFSVQFSITNEERENYLKNIGHNKMNKTKIYKFIQILESAYKYKNFKVESPHSKTPYRYITQKPFRPAMVFNMSQIHLLLFHEVHCNRCSPKKTYEKPDPKLLLELIESEGIERVHRNWRIYAFMQTGKASLLHKRDAKVLRYIRDEHRQFKIPLEQVEKILSEIKSLPKAEWSKFMVDRMTGIEGQQIENMEVVTKELTEKIDADSIKKDQDEIDLGDNPEDEEEGVNALAGSMEDEGEE